MLKNTKNSFPELYDLISRELKRQESNIELIAGDCVVPREVMELNGCIFANKALEGNIGLRFHAGAGIADEMERMGTELTKKLFGAGHANLQPYSGSAANYAVYAAIAEAGDTILSMRLDQGGHLTHGSQANFLSKFFHYEHYGVNQETEAIDYDELEEKARECRPKLIIAGASSYPLLIDYERIASIAKNTGAYFMVDMAHISGLVAAGVIPSPVPHADFVTSSTTKTFCGPKSGMVMCKAEYKKILNKGVFPGTIGSMHLTTMASKIWSVKYAGTREFRMLMEQVLKNSSALAEALKDYGFRLVGGKTENHIVLLDVRSRGLKGNVFQDALERAGITSNRNLIPFDPESAVVTSGIRLGTTGVTQRGMKEEDIREVAALIDRVASAPEDEKNIQECRKKTLEMSERFPLYPLGSFD